MTKITIESATSPIKNEIKAANISIMIKKLLNWFKNILKGENGWNL